MYRREVCSNKSKWPTKLGWTKKFFFGLKRDSPDKNKQKTETNKETTKLNDQLRN